LTWLLLALLAAAPADAKAPRGAVQPDLDDPAVREATQLQVLSGLIDAGLTSEALKVAADLRALGVKSPGLDLLQARALNLQGQRTEALRLLEALVDDHPRDAEAWALLGLVYADAGRPTEGVKALERAASLKKDDADILNNLGYLYLAVGENGRAVATLQRAITLNPTLRRARNNLGFALARQERDMEALEAFRGAGTEADARYNLGVACELRRDTASALNEYRAVLQLEPDYAKASEALDRLLSKETP
jgi:tetratricopeptide (TPR) repeat protein